jgi:hypothetical protein
MKLKSIHYLFSRKEKWGSKLISWASEELGSEEPAPSHVALLLNERWVFESTYSNNVSIMSYSKWKEENIERYKIESTSEHYFEEVKKLYRRIEGKKYDWKGIMYFSWRVLLYIFLGLSIPKKNKWHSEDAYFCCELVGELVGISYEMSTPAHVHQSLTKSLNL